MTVSQLAEEAAEWLRAKFKLGAQDRVTTATVARGLINPITGGVAVYIDEDGNVVEMVDRYILCPTGRVITAADNGKVLSNMGATGPTVFELGATLTPGCEVTIVNDANNDITITAPGGSNDYFWGEGIGGSVILNGTGFGAFIRIQVSMQLGYMVMGNYGFTALA